MCSKFAIVVRAGACAVLSLVCLSAISRAQVTTYHNDIARTGLNANEYVLNPTNVGSSNFGLLFSLPVDGQVYAQPLYLPMLATPTRGTHDMVFVCTEHNSVYAFDADRNTGPDANPIWHVNLGPSVPNPDTNSWDINPEIGITSTPVILTTGVTTPILFVVSKTKTLDNNGNPVYTQKLHALSATTGAEMLGGPAVIGASVPGVGDGSLGGMVQFNPLIQHNRPALLLVPPTSALHGGGTAGTPDSTIYIAYASHGDNGPYHGWLFEYDANTLQYLGVLNTTPNASTDPSGYPLAAGGIWQGGSGPASDGQSVFFATGNGTFDPSNGSYGDSVLRVLNRTFGVADYFCPADQQNLDDYDTDLGSGGLMLLPMSASGTLKKQLAVQSGKEGTIYLLDTTKLGGNNPTDAVVQELPYVMGGIWGAPAYFNNAVYFGPQYSSMVSFPIRNGQFTSSSPSSYSPTYYQYPGPTPSISANGTTNGIVWAIQADGYGSGSPAILHAYDARNLAVELYNSSNTNGRDTLGPAVKFATPTIAHGRVYVGAAGSVGVFGIGTFAATPQVNPDAGTYQSSIQVSITEDTPGATVYYTTDGTIPTTSSNKYSAPFTLSTSTTLTVKAFIGNGQGSGVVQNNYLIDPVIGSGIGLKGSYYNNQQANPTGPATYAEIDPTINFNWNGNSPVTGVAGANWAGVWTGSIRAETTGTYTLTTNSDDGVQVYINNNLIINDYNYHAPTLDSATYNFVAGQFYTIKIQYFQGTGGSLLQLFWAAPGIPTQIVPKTQLTPGSLIKP